MTQDNGKFRVAIPMNEAIQALIADGQILHNPDAVVKVGDVEVLFDELEAVTLEAATALVGGQVDLVLDVDEKTGEKTPARGKPSVVREFNYGYGLNARRYVRQQYETQAAGPEKQINKGVAALVALGYSQEEAETIAKAKVQAAQ